MPSSIPVPIGPAADSRSEPGAAARVDPERREQRDLPEHPGDQEEALDAHGMADERLAEHGVGVDGREAQARGHGRAEEERRADEPGERRGRDDAEPDGAAQAGSIPGEARVRRLERELELLVPRPVADGRRGVRVAVGEEEEVRVDLGRVAEADGAEVAQPFRHPPGDERRPPAEDADDPDDDRVRAAEHQRGDREPEPEERDARDAAAAAGRSRRRPGSCRRRRRSPGTGRRSRRGRRRRASRSAPTPR